MGVGVAQIPFAEPAQTNVGFTGLLCGTEEIASAIVGTEKKTTDAIMMTTW